DHLVAVDPQALAALAPAGGTPTVPVALELRLALARWRGRELRAQRPSLPPEEKLVALRPPAAEQRTDLGRRLLLGLPRLHPPGPDSRLPPWRERSQTRP